MQKPPLLYLVHRIPYPPNKGDKLRSFHILRHLAMHYRVFLATFVDHPDDWAHVPALNTWCAGVHAVRLKPTSARIRSLRGVLTGEALSVPYYRDAGLQAWVREVVRHEDIRQAVVFSGPMAQYLEGLPLARTVIDFCDVDSAKWTQYAASRRGPMAWLYRREGRLLSNFERRWAGRADVSSFVTRAEADLFLADAPHLADRVLAIENGVDAEVFSPANGGERPFGRGGPHIVFTGAMDYWPNIDAATWFAREVMPRVWTTLPEACFTIVGMNPTPGVRALAVPERIVVTGTVPDVRPYVHHADVVVAPLRVARGIQNKVLEAMSMGRPVVASAAAATGLRGVTGVTHEEAETPEDYLAAIRRCLDPERGRAMGLAARQAVLDQYAWDAHLKALPRALTVSGSVQPEAVSA
ncbi:TIGR03087 family PEP-CTERM/XrtA system glycosyltransferase [Denitromonas iodatirespirans]|nr:TIGR03087 family PEP-CTERM/XrtA system glycosyltransferase [Denitromonas iodatirespirans]